MLNVFEKMIISRYERKIKYLRKHYGHNLISRFSDGKRLVILIQRIYSRPILCPLSFLVNDVPNLLLYLVEF